MKSRSKRPYKGRKSRKILYLDGPDKNGITSILKTHPKKDQKEVDIFHCLSEKN